MKRFVIAFGLASGLAGFAGNADAADVRGFAQFERSSIVVQAQSKKAKRSPNCFNRCKDRGGARNPAGVLAYCQRLCG